METARGIRPHWERRRQLGQELDQIGRGPDLPPGLGDRLTAMTQAIGQRQQRAEQLRQQLQQTQKKASQLSWNESLWRQLTRIHVLADQQNWIRSLDQQVRDLEQQAEEVQLETEAEQEKLGVGSESLVPLLASVGPSTRVALRRPARALRRAKQRLIRARDEAAARRNELAECERQIASVLRPDAASPDSEGPWDLVKAVEEVGVQATNLRRHLQLDDVLGQLEQYLEDIQARRERLMEQQILPARVLTGVACLFVFGFVLLLTGLFGGVFSLADSTRLLTGMMGAVSAGAAVAMKRMLEHSSTRQLHACGRQCDLIRNQAAEAREELAQLAAVIPQGNGTLAARLGRSEDRLAKLERLLPVDAQRQELSQQLQEVEQQRQQAAAAHKAARDSWQAALRSVGLSPELNPAQIRQLTDQSGRLSHLRSRWTQLSQQLEFRRGELASVQSRLSQLLAEVHITPPDGAGPVEQLELLIQTAKRQEQIASQRRSHRQQMLQLRREHDKLQRSARLLQRKRLALMSAAGVSSDADLQQLETRRTTLHQRRGEWEQLTREITQLLGDQVLEEAVARELNQDASDQLEERLRRLKQQAAEADTKLKQLSHQQGELSQRMKTLESDRQLAERNLQCACIQNELDRGANRWKALAVTTRLLETVYRQYESDRQPETLREASGYLARFTAGRYTRVWTPLSQNALRIDQADGRSLPIEVLSRGTREQVYLSLRLALVAAYARRGMRMPMVLDDVLVNFDSDRALAAVEVLKDFSGAGHQLLVFTCHAHVRNSFQQLAVEVRQLPRRDPAPAATDDQNENEHKRRQRKAARPVRQQRQRVTKSALQGSQLGAARSPGQRTTHRCSGHIGLLEGRAGQESQRGMKSSADDPGDAVAAQAHRHAIGHVSP